MSERGRKAIFADLVFGEQDQSVEVVEIGGVSHYVILDGDFRRHVEAEYVDRQILEMMQERMRDMRDLIADGVVEMFGEEHLFTRASVDFAIENLDRILDAGVTDVDQLRTALWMTKFRAVVDIHGDVVALEMPGWDGSGDEDDG